MLFLAVFAGFLAENQREHYIEGKREKKYIQSIVEDIKSDTAFISRFLIDQDRSIQAYDSVIILLNQENRSNNQQQRLYYLQRIAIYLSSPVLANENAYDQMKNSGNLRLIKTQKIADSISSYYFFVKSLKIINDLMTLRQQSVTEFEGKIFDGSVFRTMVNKTNLEILPPLGNPQLVTDDKKTINDFIVRIHYLQSIMVYSVRNVKLQWTKAMDLLLFLNEEYHMK